MAVTVEEMYGRRLTGESGERTYRIAGTTDEATARTALLAEAPETLDDIPRKTASVEVTEAEHDGQVWIGSVPYGYSSGSGGGGGGAASGGELVEPGDSTFAFDTTGETVHISSSLGTRSEAKVGGGTARDFKSTISVTEDGAEGCDIVAPGLSITITKLFAGASITSGFIDTLYMLTGHVNSANATIKGKTFPAGTVLFLGAQGTERSNGEAEVTFQFTCSPNDATYDAGNSMTLNKAGWDYVWWFHEEEEDAATHTTVLRPVSAYSEQVYPYADLTALPVVT